MRKYASVAVAGTHARRTDASLIPGSHPQCGWDTRFRRSRGFLKIFDRADGGNATRISRASGPIKGRSLFVAVRHT